MIQATLNRILNLNPYYLEYLAEVAGLSLAVDCTDFPFQATLVFNQSYIAVSLRVEPADLKLSGHLSDFIVFAAQTEKRQKLLESKQIRFEGDLMALQKLESFLNHFDFKGFPLLPMQKIKQFLSNQTEYLQEEKQLLASPVLFDHFKDQVLALQQEIDRFDARINHLSFKQNTLK